jgi:crotonobetainyl-CoA:carnitine CoA-transferase CaiB-like acyl-CoA transferase
MPNPDVQRRSSPERPLGSYRVIEMPGLAPLLAGKTFADLGADVIKVEPPGGDPTRRLGPLITGRSDSESSLLWASYALGKRNVTLDISTRGGRELLWKLLHTADAVIEGDGPDKLDEVGISRADLRAAFPQLVITSITPFGEGGPYSQLKASDLVQFAMGGYLNMTGSPDGRPIKPSAPYQTFLHAAMHATMGTLLALRQRRRTGSGAIVDQSIRDTGVWMLTHTYQHFDMLGVNLGRQGAARDMGGTAVRLPAVYSTADGFVVWLFLTGHVGGPSVAALVQWMQKEGKAPDWMLELEWQSLDLISAGPEMTARLHQTFSAFFETKTKAELLAFALEHRVMLGPVQTLDDLLNDVQLSGRAAWRSLPIGEEEFRVPGSPVRLSEGTWEPRGLPALPGTHNVVVYREELGIDPDELALLQRDGTI